MSPPSGDPLSLQTNTVALGAGLPPVFFKLVVRIEAGEFIDMGELLPDHVGKPSILEYSMWASMISVS